MVSEDPKMRRIRYAVAQLRHLYQQMVSDGVHDTRAAARGLLAPSIEALEDLLTPYEEAADPSVERARLLEME